MVTVISRNQTHELSGDVFVEDSNINSHVEINDVVVEDLYIKVNSHVEINDVVVEDSDLNVNSHDVVEINNVVVEDSIVNTHVEIYDVVVEDSDLNVNSHDVVEMNNVVVEDSIVNTRIEIDNGVVNHYGIGSHIDIYEDIILTNDEQNKEMETDCDKGKQFEKYMQRNVVISAGFGSPFDNYDDYESSICCMICFDNFPLDEMLFCHICELYNCFHCLSSHTDSQILEGKVHLVCGGDSCTRALPDEMISAFSPKLMPIYIKNKVELENNPNMKTCPSCHKVESVSDKIVERKIRCSLCNVVWCFNCHAPWHSGMTCKSYQNDKVGPGKKALKYWAKSNGRINSNARKCPKCHFYIERISGCDHMTCSK